MLESRFMKSTSKTKNKETNKNYQGDFENN